MYSRDHKMDMRLSIEKAQNNFWENLKKCHPKSFLVMLFFRHEEKMSRITAEKP